MIVESIQKLIQERYPHIDHALINHFTSVDEIVNRVISGTLLKDTQIYALIADFFGCTLLFDIPSEPNQEAFEYLPINLAQEYLVYPLHVHNSVLTVCTSKPWELQTLQLIENIVDGAVRVTVATHQQISDALISAERSLDGLQGATEEFLLIDDSGQEKKDTGQLDDENTAPIVKFINTILKTALGRRASDIHIEAYEKTVVVKYRIDGQLYNATEDLDISFHSAFVSRLKVMAELDIAERRVPQDGRFKLRFSNTPIDFRVSVLPGIYGENVVIRVLDGKGVSKDWHQLSLQGLGMPEEQVEQFHRVIREPYGMVLITGPTGSGKTTTLYTALREAYTGGEKVITIEDPVEYQLPGITQIQVNTKKGLTFSKGLRSILRHDPDRILVGEIRDAETADIAVQSALTGHLVFSSVHANSAKDVLARLQNMGVDINNALIALNAILAQRLIRILCPECKEEDSVSEEYLKQNDIEASAVLYKANGCPQCSQTGYIGREMISELLVINSEDNLNLDNPEASSTSYFVAGQTLRSVAVKRLLEGETSLSEINRVTFA